MAGTAAKTTKDQNPSDAARINDILAFLKDRLSPEDYATLENMVDDMVDEAEGAKSIAADSLPQWQRRYIRRKVRETIIGAGGASGLAQDRALRHRPGSVTDFNDRFGTARLRSLDNGPQPPKPRPTMDAASQAGFNDRFGTHRFGRSIED